MRPSAPITRWAGIRSASGVDARARATPRCAFGRPIDAAISAFHRARAVRRSDAVARRSTHRAGAVHRATVDAAPRDSRRVRQAERARRNDFPSPHRRRPQRKDRARTASVRASAVAEVPAVFLTRVGVKSAGRAGNGLEGRAFGCERGLRRTVGLPARPALGPPRLAFAGHAARYAASALRAKASARRPYEWKRLVTIIASSAACASAMASMRARTVSGEPAITRRVRATS